jgi:predicted acetyltransferase
MDIELLRPTINLTTQVHSYKTELLESGTTLPISLEKAEDSDNWLDFLNRNERGEISGEIPTTFLLAVRKVGSKVVGHVSIRHHINDEYFSRFGGHIGYAVRPTEQRKGYGSEILRLTLSEIAKLGLQKVLITCDSINVASAKIIKANGGKYESEVNNNGILKQRYWIEIEGEKNES